MIAIKRTLYNDLSEEIKTDISQKKIRFTTHMMEMQARLQQVYLNLNQKDLQNLAHDYGDFILQTTDELDSYFWPPNYFKFYLFHANDSLEVLLQKN